MSLSRLFVALSRVGCSLHTASPRPVPKIPSANETRADPPYPSCVLSFFFVSGGASSGGAASALYFLTRFSSFSTVARNSAASASAFRRPSVAVASSSRANFIFASWSLLFFQLSSLSDFWILSHVARAAVSSSSVVVTQSAAAFFASASQVNLSSRSSSTSFVASSSVPWKCAWRSLARFSCIAACFLAVSFAAVSDATWFRWSRCTAACAKSRRNV
mmetsp:Transcript_35275/g.109335  ORF Transcript_35275/g.109335 Transcript_35275/m.109335 type:complete len:218 (+) Transcript_35275:124-777(+)